LKEIARICRINCQFPSDGSKRRPMAPRDLLDGQPARHNLSSIERGGRWAIAADCNRRVGRRFSGKIARLVRLSLQGGRARSSIVEKRQAVVRFVPRRSCKIARGLRFGP
jgi:hypothetical protein